MGDPIQLLLYLLFAYFKWKRFPVHMEEISQHHVAGVLDGLGKLPVSLHPLPGLLEQGQVTLVGTGQPAVLLQQAGHHRLDARGIGLGEDHVEADHPGPAAFQPAYQHRQLGPGPGPHAQLAHRALVHRQDYHVGVFLEAGRVAFAAQDELAVQPGVFQVDHGIAAVAGLEPGDVVVALDGHRITDGVGELQEFVHARPNQEITLTILRDGERLQLSAVPRLQSGGYGMLGIVIADWPDRSALIHYSLPEAFQAGMTDIRTIIAAMAQLPFRIAQGSVAPQDVRPTGMVGISQVLTFSLQQAIEWKMLFPILQTAGLISLALGLTNLLPLPGLDGGRIVFVLIETIRGRRVSPELEATVHAVGMILMIGLALLMLVQDFANPIIPWSLLQ